MVRKQLYIDERQDRALKRRARELGLSEAELVRRALDAALAGEQRPLPGRKEALESFLQRAVELARCHRSPARRWSREELYEERLRRWGR